MRLYPMPITPEEGNDIADRHDTRPPDTMNMMGNIVNRMSGKRLN